MAMTKIPIEKLKDLSKKYGLKPCKIRGTDIVHIRKRSSGKFEDVFWEEFSKVLKRRKLAVYKADNSDFLKIMKDI